MISIDNIDCEICTVKEFVCVVFHQDVMQRFFTDNIDVII